jgi:hypothetical protein
MQKESDPPCLKGEVSTSPKFESGLLYASGAHKGLALRAFLEAFDLHYTKIIFVDDRSKNSTDMYDSFVSDNSVDVEIYLYLEHSN